MERSHGLGYVGSGFALAIFAFASYLFLFVRFPITRDVPWVNFLLFAIAGVLLLVGLRHVFGGSPTLRRKITAVGLSLLSLAIFALFCNVILFATKLPPAKGAPRVGEKAPEFELQDTSGKPITLAELLVAPLPGTPARPPKGVMLIFYRGYW
jgi:ABC-type transport system involved in multi-copper enzyme maturation permease subunit